MQLHVIAIPLFVARWMIVITHMFKMLRVLVSPDVELIITQRMRKIMITNAYDAKHAEMRADVSNAFPYGEIK